MTFALPSWAIRALDLPPEAGPTARDMDALHATIITITFAGTAAVALMTLYYVIRYRRKREFEATPAVVASGKREWIQGALLLGMFLAFWVWGYAQYIHIETPPDHSMVVYVSAKQWMWKFSYDDGQTSNDVLYVPEHRKVRLVMTSRDVIHSFFAPSFRVKQDVIPGRWVNAWLDAAEPGVYPIYCAEFCGVGHSTMLGEIHVLTEAEWAKWRRGADPEEMIARGREAATKNGCFACHTLDGQRHIGPSWSRLYGSQVKLTDGTTVLADEAYLTQSMMDPLAQIVDGYQPVMPSYRGHLQPEDVGAIVELIRSLKDGGGKEPTIALPKLVVEKTGQTTEKQP
ncbi:MAG TPA: cytochrome c oxidase subunit II [Polyangiaceae bacterium]|jgi:cytochrome c oxidase subunit 2